MLKYAAKGANLNGRFFPEGSVVGVNAWVAHYDERTFSDARAFRPERWLESETSSERLKEMNQMYMPVCGTPNFHETGLQ